jgi:hypothetical protein
MLAHGHEPGQETWSRKHDKNCRSLIPLWLISSPWRVLKTGHDLKFALKTNNLGGISRFLFGKPCGFERATQFMYSTWTFQ